MSQAAGVLAGLVILVMMVHIVVDVICRVVFRSPLPGTLEYITYWWMPTLIFLSLGAAESARSHIRVTILVDKVSPGIGRTINTVAHAVTACTVGLILFYGVRGAMASAKIQQAALGTAVVPIWIPKIIMTVGLAVFFLQVFVSVWREISQPRSLSPVSNDVAEGVSQ